MSQSGTMAFLENRAMMQFIPWELKQQGLARVRVSLCKHLGNYLCVLFRAARSSRINFILHFQYIPNTFCLLQIDALRHLQASLSLPSLPWEAVSPWPTEAVGHCSPATHSPDQSTHGYYQVGLTYRLTSWSGLCLP